MERKRSGPAPQRAPSRAAGLTLARSPSNYDLTTTGAYLANAGSKVGAEDLAHDHRSVHLASLALQYYRLDKEGNASPHDMLNFAFNVRNADRFKNALRAATAVFILVNFGFVAYDIGRFGTDNSTFLTVLLIRLGGILPAAIAIMALTFTQWYRTHSWLLIPFIFALGALSVAYSVVGEDPGPFAQRHWRETPDTFSRQPPPSFPTGYGTLALLITVTFSFTPLHFWVSFTLSALWVAGLGIGVALNPPPTAKSNVAVADIFGTLAFFLVAVAFAGRALDMQLRQSFLDEFKLRVESDMTAVEQKRSAELLNSMLPRSIQRKLRRMSSRGGTSIADSYKHVTVLFCEIYKFASWCQGKRPETVVQVLNIVYSHFDDLLDNFSPGAVHKVETVGEVYMVVSGAPRRTPRHAEHAADMALSMVAALPDIRASIHTELGFNADDLHIRIGLNSGSIMAGVTGLTQPRFKLFGDTVNTASRMESTSEPDHIQVSVPTAELLQAGLQKFHLKNRGGVQIKGKGTMTTYWLYGSDGVLPKRTFTYTSSPHSSRRTSTHSGAPKQGLSGSARMLKSVGGASGASQSALLQMMDDHAPMPGAPTLQDVEEREGAGSRAQSVASTSTGVFRDVHREGVMLQAPPGGDVEASSDGEGHQPSLPSRPLTSLDTATDHKPFHRSVTDTVRRSSLGVVPGRSSIAGEAQASSTAAASSPKARAPPISYATREDDDSGLAHAPVITLDDLTAANAGVSSLSALLKANVATARDASARSGRRSGSADAGAVSVRSDRTGVSSTGADGGSVFPSYRSAQEGPQGSARSQAVLSELGLAPPGGVDTSRPSDSGWRQVPLERADSTFSPLAGKDPSPSQADLASHGFVTGDDDAEERFQRALEQALAQGGGTQRTRAGSIVSVGAGGTPRTAAAAAVEVEDYLAALNPEHGVGGDSARLVAHTSGTSTTDGDSDDDPSGGKSPTSGGGAPSPPPPIGWQQPATTAPPSTTHAQEAAGGTGGWQVVDLDEDQVEGVLPTSAPRSRAASDVVSSRPTPDETEATTIIVAPAGDLKKGVSKSTRDLAPSHAEAASPSERQEKSRQRFRVGVTKALASEALNDAGEERRTRAQVASFSALCFYHADEGTAAAVIENLFTREQSVAWRRFARMSVWGALAASVLFLLYDTVRLTSSDGDRFRTDIWPALAIARYGVLVPVLLLFWAATATETFRRSITVAQYVTGATLLATGLCLIAISILGRQPGYGVLALFIVYSLNISLLAYAYRMALFTTLILVYAVAVSMSAPIVDIPITFSKVSIDVIYLLVFFLGQALPVLASEYHVRHNFLRRIQVRRQRAALRKEQRKSQTLLSNLLPRSIVKELKLGRELIADFYKEGTIVFTDLRGFTAFSSTVTPAQLVSFLNVLFSTFDRIASKFGVHKVELIGDAYFGVAGVPGAAADQAERAANMALEMLMHMPAMRAVAGNGIMMRVGIHTGPVIAGVVGRKDPRYHLFGETVDIAMGMESSGIPDRVQISRAAYERLARRQFVRTVRYLRTLAALAELQAFRAADALTESAQEASASSKVPMTPGSAMQRLLPTLKVPSAEEADEARDEGPAHVAVDTTDTEEHQDSISSPELFALGPPKEVPHLELSKSMHSAPSETSHHLLEAAGGYTFAGAGDEVRVPTRSVAALGQPRVWCDLPESLVAWMYLTVPMPPSDLATSKPSPMDLELAQGAHTDVTQIWNGQHATFLGFDLEGSSVMTGAHHPLLRHTLGEDAQPSCCVATLKQNPAPPRAARASIVSMPSLVASETSVGMATGKVVQPARDVCDDVEWMNTPSAASSGTAESAATASGVAVDQLLPVDLDAESLVARTRLEVREELLFRAAVARGEDPAEVPSTSWLDLLTGLQNIKEPQGWLKQQFFGPGGGFFAFTHRGMQDIKGVGEVDTYMLSRAFPPGLKQ